MKIQLNPIIFNRMTYFLWGFRIAWDSVGFDGHASLKFHQRNLLQSRCCPRCLCPLNDSEGEAKMSLPKSIRNMKTHRRTSIPTIPNGATPKHNPKIICGHVENLLSGFPDENKSMFDSTKWWPTPFYRVKSRAWFPNHNCPSHPFLHL